MPSPTVPSAAESPQAFLGNIGKLQCKQESLCMIGIFRSYPILPGNRNGTDNTHERQSLNFWRLLNGFHRIPLRVPFRRCPSSLDENACGLPQREPLAQKQSVHKEPRAANNTSQIMRTPSPCPQADRGPVLSGGVFPAGEWCGFTRQKSKNPGDEQHGTASRRVWCFSHHAGERMITDYILRVDKDQNGSSPSVSEDSANPHALSAMPLVVPT